MLKKFVPLAAVLLFAVSVLFVSVQRTAFVEVRPSLAATTLKFSVSPLPSPSASVSSQPKVNYFLAYPGLLPDSPLYKVKMIRDRIWIWLTNGSVERANLFLLYADKRLGAGKVLIEGNKASLGLSTLLKGEKYLEQAIEEARKAKKDGRELKGLAEKLRNATLKHEEVLLELKERVNDEGKAAFDDLLKFVHTLQQKVTEI
ncbi:MAG TPA: DUF5667 domain-containing protein [Patescibacteria group bacterium]|nr:DUF5667 domain-containing protein [Patescibacteria group bacterium]